MVGSLAYLAFPQSHGWEVLPGGTPTTVET